MPAYRFCRTDDMGLLVEAWNRCRLAHDADERPLTLGGLKAWIRELDLWCSSCMVATEAGETIGVVLGCKRPTETLVLDVAVHPAHVRRGHGRHLLDSLARKLRILGPPRIVAEVPEDRPAAMGFFAACGFAPEARLTDWTLETPPPAPAAGAADLVVPVSLEDLEAAGLLDEGAERPWGRALPSLRNRRRALEGLAIASEERIEAHALVLPRSGDGPAEITALGEGPSADGAVAVGVLVNLVAARHGRLLFPRVAEGEVPPERLRGWGFRPAGTYRHFARQADRT